MQVCVTKTASTWDSYKEWLIKVLDSFEIMSVLEYGPGESTRIIQKNKNVTLIDSIEHNEAWAARGKEGFDHKVKVTIEPDEFKYPYVKGRTNKYDLIFIDGTARVNCLMLAPFRLRKDGIVILHDAERPEYKQAIGIYEFKFPVDDGHTLVMTNEQDVALKLSEILW